MGDDRKSSPVIESKSQLVEYIASGAKPVDAWRIGTEHEKFGFNRKDNSPLPYEGANGVKAMLEGLQRFGWEAVNEGENVIALKQDGASITLEPGGQFELSGAPLENLHQTCKEVNTHLDQVRQVSDEIGVGYLGMGFAPTWRREDIHVMPKGRYDVMRRYMPTRGNLGLDMMLRSCTVQVNLDFGDEADMVEKFRISLALQPVATALFANSPFKEGKPSGYLSYRSHIWTDTDPDRCGMLPFVFEEGMGYERWVDYLLDVPMYFVYRDGIYHDVAGRSFRDFMAGKLAGFEGQIATMADWEDHMTTAFPEVRLKKYLEMRGADGGPWKRLCALPAFWVGLLYDGEAQSAAWDLVKDFTQEEMAQLRDEVPRQALGTSFRGGTVLDLARQALEISEQGLKNRARAGFMTGDETEYLEALRQVVDSGKTNAELLLESYHGKWSGDVERVFAEQAY